LEEIMRLFLMLMALCLVPAACGKKAPLRPPEAPQETAVR
jgi:predicted small lipoprotein YifL